ncbi:MAG: F420-non-reducing hydrogenase iron-sulfur subunit [Moorella sp. (in: firmicutes)]|uniref:hydrogenase iron-sulfur subunit n=1 Tax=unclassified Neomoorella TaxID=2676739 RepID=UPI0010FFC06D|nr:MULTISPECIES: hydrogenase iron-sulfur subunit [unclassified Moorella (in: firmicutes)]MDK2817070.1 F420-non-reducing hydrogenase iron-sulfur subunit [Moorella sp. (in: firmicutes)]MDK2894813.1 F420-non-reducing hydrogenase iron-sulfur subunit [Moorella sp. (in: firmicutes)]GEA15605.1 methyl-viologen-reducing hydrogenase subunit delta [Moorella sp. E308F]GEA19537.1 methyl-viologen-reducing hydrogenase subunit delta [Moorella sp. E306M]
MQEFEPKIIAFCCFYCAYSAADLAGSLRLQYPANIRVIEMPCSGKTDVRVLLEAFEDGADGVYVLGCMEGDCHFLKGNFRAKRRVQQAKKILDEIGIGGERLEMYNLSAAMGPRFAEIAREFTERIRKLGPSPLNKNYASSRQGEDGRQAANSMKAGEQE